MKDMYNSPVSHHSAPHRDYALLNALVECRKKACFKSQERLAEFLDVDTKTVSRWETGDVDIRHADYRTVRRLVRLYGPEFEALLEDSPEGGPFISAEIPQQKTPM